MRSVCLEYVGLRPNLAGNLMTAAGQIVPSRIRDIATEFVALQDARIRADYDTTTVIIQRIADLDVMRAESAFIDWAAVQNDPGAAVFLAELFCRGIPRR